MYLLERRIFIRPGIGFPRPLFNRVTVAGSLPPNVIPEPQVRKEFPENWIFNIFEKYDTWNFIIQVTFVFMTNKIPAYYNLTNIYWIYKMKIIWS